MRSAQVLSILALAGSTLALPSWGGWSGSGKWGGSHEESSDDSAVATEVAVVTAYTTVTWGGNWGHGRPTPTPTPAATESHDAPATESPAFGGFDFGGNKPAPSKSGSDSSSSDSGSTSGGYMGVVEKWRGKLGLGDLSEDSTLQANALKTCQDGNGEMVHELNPGSMAQVLAPGSADEFEKVFVGGWLCERSNLPGLDGICSEMSQGWEYNGETGHADILVSGSYSKIGCALANGIWGCDLA